MRMAIKGKSQRTITLNCNNLILRGTEAAIIEVNTEEQMAELRALEGVNLIRTINVDEYEKSKEKESVNNSETPYTDIIDVSTPSSDIIDTDNNEDSEVVEEIEDSTKRKRGRPKGSKNKKTVEESSKKETNQEMAEISEFNDDEFDDLEEPEDDSPTIATLEIPDTGPSVATIHTGQTVIQRTMVNQPIVSEQEDSEDVQASLEAMAILEQEEADAKASEEQGLDEKDMDVNEQMGRSATIATLQGSKTVTMKNSVIPEADAIKKSDPFIDMDDTKPRSDDAFLDDDDKDGPEFIEI